MPDKDDKCPQVFGLIEMNGCPDSDSDGISDNDDDCPADFFSQYENGAYNLYIKCGDEIITNNNPIIINGYQIKSNDNKAKLFISTTD